MKIVINKCFGGFSLSEKAEKRLRKNAKITDKDWYSRSVSRDDPFLVEIVETMGKKANGKFAELKVVEIPDGVDWEIEEYDGQEWVSEKHRTWG